ncbi:MAG: 3-oxoacyl-[acyl-carrier-protein] reductase [Chloroflexi bacterium]|nr:3-oxoacyl-[acyl-carrier-protein] reductase [Chloroflexota bacterium]
MQSLEGRVALITGASRGIGRAIAVELAAQGATVVVNYRSNQDAASAVVDEIIGAGGKANAIGADVSQFEAAGDLVAQTIEQHGQLDILVNNAGIARDNLILRLGEDDWDTVIETNLKSVFNTCKAVFKPMMRKRYGRIINISSVSGIAGNAGQTNYSASKAGMIGFSRALAREAATRGITVNVIAPGFISTDMTEDLTEDLKDLSLAAIPLGRWGDAQEVAYAVAFLASERAGYITGQVLSVDGGMVMA